MRMFWTVYIICLPYVSNTASCNKVAFVEKAEVVKENTIDRLNRICGIPQGTEWSYAVKCKYSKNILHAIDSLEKSINQRRKERFKRCQTK